MFITIKQTIIIIFFISNIYCGLLKQPLIDNSQCNGPSTITSLFQKYYLVAPKEAKALYFAIEMLNEIDETSYEYIFSLFPYKMIPYVEKNIRVKKYEIKKLIEASTKQEAAKLIKTAQIFKNLALVLSYPPPIDENEKEKSKFIYEYALGDISRRFDSTEFDKVTVEEFILFLIPEIPVIFGPLYQPSDFNYICCSIS